VKYRRGQNSGYVNDQRGRRVGGGGVAMAGGGGLAAIVIAVIVALMSGGGGGGGGGFDPGDILGQLGAPTGGVEADPNIETGTGGEADDATEDFMRAVMNSLQDDFWPTQDVEGWRPTALTLFTQAVSTGCGQATSAVGPFYCPADELAYIDLEFFQELESRFGAPGQFAQAYVIAHEVGHHVQNIVGLSDQVHQAPQSQQQGADGLSVRLELQADCFAGLWAASVFGPGSDIEITQDDVRDALDAAEAIGDDRLQEQAGVDVNPETWSHGSSEQRQEWFNRGFEGGELSLCDTFNTEL
jgi:predicted metalloprotease